MIPSHARLLLLYTIFFVSGMSSLICEITWARMLVLVLGNSIPATGMILTAFMGGLALGGYWGGRAFGRRASSLRAYALLEIGIGLYAVASPLFLHPASQAFLLVATDSPALPVLHFARFALAFVCLFAPAFLMGATFPAILAGSASAGSPLTSSRTGFLYAVNTLGAALGAVAAGYLLLPRWGTHLTLAWASGLSLLAASGGLLIERLAKAKTKTGSDPVLRGETGSDPVFPAPGLKPAVFAGVFATGFIALSYEVIMTRLVILYFGNELLVFTLVVTAFLAGVGLSALGVTALTSRLVGSGSALAAFSLAAGLSVVGPPALLVQLSQGDHEWLKPAHDLLVAGILLIPACLMGSLLPLAIRVIQEREAPAASVRAAGTLYALNTIGGMLGAGATNTMLIPLLGIEATLLGFSATCLAVGASLLLALRAPMKRVAPALLAVLLTLVWTASRPHLLGDLYTRKLAGYSGGDPEPAIRLYREGSVATAIVLDFPWLGFRDMFLNGVEEASTRFGHVQLFKLLGLLPVALHPSEAPQDALMIAFGAGIASGATLGAGQISTLTCVDLNPDVEAINDLFRDVNGDVFHDPRFRFVADDGRNFLLRSSARYGVIISDSTHPRSYDSWILYTEEFYRTVRSRLTPDGVFAQWIPLSDISVENFRILLNTFTTVFPHATLWTIYGTDQAFLVATPAPFTFDLPRIQQRLDGAAESVRLARYQLDQAARVAGFFVMDPEAIARFIGSERRINTDDLPFNQKYAIRTHTPLRAQSFDRYQAGIGPYLRGATEGHLRFADERQALARAMHRYFFFGDESALEEAVRIDPDDGNVRFFQDRAARTATIAMEKMRRDSARLRGERDRLMDHVRRSPENGPAHLRLAQINLKLHQIDGAETAAITALKHSPDSVEARKVLAQVYSLKGDWSKARALYEEALRRDRSDVTAATALVGILAERREFGAAVELLQAMGPRSEQDFQYYLVLAGAYYATEDFEKARDALSHVLTLYPGSTEARLHLADVHLKTHRRELAVAELERLLQINPYHEPALTLLRSLRGATEK